MMSTVVAVDQGHGSGVVLPSYSTSVCSTCLTYCMAPLPCTSCTMVVFCSEECHDVGVSSHHGRECGLLPALRALDMGRNTELALRMVTNHDLGSLKQLLRNCEDETRTTARPSGADVRVDGGHVGGNMDSNSCSNINKDLSDNHECEANSSSSYACDKLETLFQNLNHHENKLKPLEEDVKGQTLSEVDAGLAHTVECLETNSPSSDLMVGCAPDGVYGSHDYRSVYHLVGNKAGRTVADLFKRSVMACVVLKLLEKSGYFAGTVSGKPVLDISFTGLSDWAAGVNVDPCCQKVNESLVKDEDLLTRKSDDRNLEAIPSSSSTNGANTTPNDAATPNLVPNAPKNEVTSFPTDQNTVRLVNDALKPDTMSVSLESDLVTVGSALLRHMLNLPCNAHSVTLFHLDPANLLNSHSEEVGANAFGVLSLTNHSCSPNCYRQSFGGVGVLRAIEFIPKGAEVFDCYGAHFALDTKAERLLMLKKQYYFECGCDACFLDWHGIRCRCRLCEEKYCKDCALVCKDGVCKKSVETLPFKLKCLSQSCKGIMNRVTNTCSECLQQYDSNSSTIRSILGIKNAANTTNAASFVASGNLNASIKQNAGATNDNICADKVGSRHLSSDTAANKHFCHNHLETSDMGESKASVVLKATLHEELSSAPVSVALVTDLLQSLLSEYDTACCAVVGGNMDEGSLRMVERAVTALSALVVRPNKQLLRAQELLKHCYDRIASHLLLPSPAHAR